MRGSVAAWATTSWRLREERSRQLRPGPSPTLYSTVRHDEFFFVAFRTVCSIASLTQTSLLWRASTRAVLRDAGNLAMANLAMKLTAAFGTRSLSPSRWAA